MNTVKLAKSALKSAMPFQAEARRLKRRFVPYQDNPANSHYCITQGLEQIEALRAAGVNLHADVLEFGTGWLPLAPLLFHLAGAKSLTLTDIEPLMDQHTIARAKNIVRGRIDDVARVLDQPAEQLLERLEAGFQPTYLAPWDCGAHEHQNADIIVSRAVLEHVPEIDLHGFLREFHRLLRPGGVMCHVIDNSDHREHQDKTISRCDFLRYDERSLLWRLANVNPQDFQNRLRHSDYRRMFRLAGFMAVTERGVPDPQCLLDLRSLPLALRFQEHDRTDLAILTSMFLLRR